MNKNLLVLVIALVLFGYFLIDRKVGGLLWIVFILILVVIGLINSKAFAQSAPARDPRVKAFFKGLRRENDDQKVVQLLLARLENLKPTDDALIPTLAAVELVRRKNFEIIPSLEELAPKLPKLPRYFDETFAALHGIGVIPPDL